MNTKCILAANLCLILPHCAPKKPQKTFNTITEESQKRFNTEPAWKATSTKEQVDTLIENGITFDDAITIGIKNNPSLQVKFEELGISQSDLTQAGFYNNPNIDSVFKVPRNKELRKKIEVTTSFVLSDLWQVPLRKKIAQYDLEIKTHEIINAILHVRYHIQKQYLTCLYHQEQVQITKEIATTLHTLKNKIHYRYKFGYANKLDKYFIDSKLGTWETKVINAQRMLQQAYLDLRELLGSTIVKKTIPLSAIPETSMNIPSLAAIKDFALCAHPNILIEQAKIHRAQQSISYEKSKILDNVQLGFSYEREFEKKASGIGPALSLDIPIFDTNYGNIERAKYMLKQAEKSLTSIQQAISKQVTVSYTNYQSYIKQIAHYEATVIPPMLQALEFSKEFFDRMQMSILMFLEAQIDLYQHKQELIEIAYKAATEYANLELALGSQLKAIHSQNAT